MSAAIVKEGKSYRMRRGVLVEIPAEWVGKHTHRKTIRQRPSKMTGKRARDTKRDGSWKSKRRHIEAKDQP